ncbi:MAG: PfkB family carbohydrate kinase, partial [Bacteroidales bacterium]
YFISEVGNDHIGKMIIKFMQENNLPTKSVDIFPDGETAISLAFLDSNSDAQYSFYTKYPNTRLSVVWPKIDPDDIFIMGSFYAIDPLIRDKIIELLDYAKEHKTIIYYDPNFRKSHSSKAIQMMPSLLENFEYADIVRGSKEDFLYMFGEMSPEKIYHNKIRLYCPIFIYTSGAGGVDLFTPEGQRHYNAEKISPISTIGAGDNFNAGVIYGIISNGILKEELKSLTLNEWDKIITCGISFAKEVCCSYDNYIGNEYAKKHALTQNADNNNSATQ